MGHHPPLGLSTAPWNCHGASGVSFSFLIEDQGLVEADLSAILDPVDSGLCCVLGLFHSFKSHALPLSLLLHYHPGVVL